MEDRRPKNNPRPERIVGQERQHLLLSFTAAQIRWLFFDLGNTLAAEAAVTEARLRPPFRTKWQTLFGRRHPPAEGNALICCWRPQGDIVIDL
jgi:hypothetical protein